MPILRQQTRRLATTSWCPTYLKPSDECGSIRIWRYCYCGHEELRRCHCAMSQYAQTISMTDPAALILSMMNDASDGIMNGRWEAPDNHGWHGWWHDGWRRYHDAVHGRDQRIGERNDFVPGFCHEQINPYHDQHADAHQPVEHHQRGDLKHPCLNAVKLRAAR